MIRIASSLGPAHHYFREISSELGINEMRFRTGRYPSVPPKQDYAPTRNAQKPPGYAEIEAVSASNDSEAWLAFVRDVMKMPESFTPAIQEAVRQQRWKIAPNPVASIRTIAYQEAKKMGLG
jgi:hypothetical protein